MGREVAPAQFGDELGRLGRWRGLAGALLAPLDEPAVVLVQLVVDVRRGAARQGLISPQCKWGDRRLVDGRPGWSRSAA